MGESTFGKRLGQIMQNKDMSRGALKDATGISLQSICNYLNDKRKPDCEIVAEIATALNVSSDYLLGLSDIPSRDEQLQGVHEKTGLSESAINHLTTLKQQIGGEYAKGRLDFYSSFITDFGIIGLIELYPGIIYSLKHKGMSDEQSGVFENIDEAIRFYRFEAMETIMRFLDRYFSDVKVVSLREVE